GNVPLSFQEPPLRVLVRTSELGLPPGISPAPAAVRSALRRRLDLSTLLLLMSHFDRAGADGDVPGGDADRLEEDDVVRRAAPRDLARDHLVQFVHLEPVEDAALDRLDQVARLELCLLDRVAADEDGALEDDVVELAGLRLVRAHGADERSRLQPLAAQDGVLRGRDRDDHVLLSRISVALTGLG